METGTGVTRRGTTENVEVLALPDKEGAVVAHPPKVISAYRLVGSLEVSVKPINNAD